MMAFEPAYIRSLRDGVLTRKIRQAFRAMQSCELCPRLCRVNRFAGQRGVCRTGKRAVVASYSAHFGEEAPLVGRNGSGTVFFTHCNLLCRFCQNYEISHGGQGQEASARQLAAIMLRLQQQGCHNINFVTPTHVVPQILLAVYLAAGNGLSIPLVYNSAGYDRVETLKLLDGVFDIYMPDFKFWDPAVAETTCRAKDYPEVAGNAIREMHRQVGDLVLDMAGLAVRGVLIRHLVLPGGAAGTREVMRFISTEISPDSYVNVMAQYRPLGRAGEIPGFNRRTTREEYEAALEAAAREGIRRLDMPRRTFVIG